MDARNRPIMRTSKFCVGILASGLVIGGSARASVIVVEDLRISANNGQAQTQQQQDLYACETWATGQSGFDPTTAGNVAAPATGGSEYRRALSACLEARGYAVQQVANVAGTTGGSASEAGAAVGGSAAYLSTPRRWQFLGRYASPGGSGRDNAVIDLTSSYNLEDVVHYVWVGGGFVQQGGQWAPGAGLWASYNLDIDCTHHTFKEHRFINHAGSFAPSDNKWTAIKDSWRPMQLAAKRVCASV